MTAEKGRPLRLISLVATLGMTSHAEIAAGAAAGLPMWHPAGTDWPGVGLPMLLPLVIDCYVVDALEHRTGGDRWFALGVLASSVVFGSVAIADTAKEARISAGVGLILVAVLWRLYVKPQPSRKDVEKLAAEQADADARAALEQDQADARERAASQLRIEEAERLAAIAARREQDAANAHAARVNAQVEADKARLEAETAAEVARIHAQAAADAANRDQEPPANPRQRRSRTVEKKPAKAPAKPSANPPAKDHAIQLVASAIRAHPGDYVFDWSAWAREHGGGKTFWWGVHKAATEPVHLAEAAS